MSNVKSTACHVLLALAVTITGLLPIVAEAQTSSPGKSAKSKPDFPPLDEVLKDYKKVVSTADGQRSYYTIWTRSKDGQMLGITENGSLRLRNRKGIGYNISVGEIHLRPVD